MSARGQVSGRTLVQCPRWYGQACVKNEYLKNCATFASFQKGERTAQMEGLLESVKMLVMYLENTKCVICYLKEENRWDSTNFICTEVALEIRRMVGEKSGKDKDGGQGLLAFLGSMYLLGKNFHFTRPKPAYGRQGQANISLRASGAQLRSDDFSWQTHKHTDTSS